MKKNLLLNKTEWLVVCIILTVVCAILSNIWEWFAWGIAFFMIYPFVLSLIMIGFAIKNTIKDLKE